MLWGHFANFAASNLDLCNCLEWHISPPVMHGSGQNAEYRGWVEQQVDFIAVRPFESLDMSATDTKYDNVTVTYAVWFHIAGEERPCSRTRYLNSDGRGTTIQGLISGLVTWHSDFWASQPGRSLVLDVIVRHNTRQHPDAKYYRESLELFRVPAEAQPLT